MQTQYEMFDVWSKDGSKHGVQPTWGEHFISNSFYIKRAGVKFTYRASAGVSFVLCSGFSINKFSLKDAYVQLNYRWINILSLYVGQFNRVTSEVEYSFSTREFGERSLMTRTFYPS